MKARGFVENILPPLGLKAIGWLRDRRALKKYLRNEKVPWSLGYNVYKRELIADSLEKSQLLDCFRCDGSLPQGFGVGIDERCIEYPWLIANLNNESERILDAGSTLNHDFVLEHEIFSQKIIHILTLAPEENCFWQKRISYLFGDLRDIPIRDEYYDTITCISALEHVGFDNTFFGDRESRKEHRPEDFLLAMGELSRILKSGGSLLLTVPFGVPRRYGAFQQFGRETLLKAIQAFGNARDVKETFYSYTMEGWRDSTAEECADCEYADWVARAWEQNKWPKSIHLEADQAAAARAVACVRLVKA